MNNYVQHVHGFLRDYLGLEISLQQDLLGTLLVLTVFFIIRYAACRVVRWKIKDIKRHYVTRKTVNYVLWFLLLLALWRVWIGPGTGLVAYLGILSAGLAIALQDPLTNLAGWIFINLRKPFTAGDRITINRHPGDVIDIELFQFTLVEIEQEPNAEQSTGRLIHIPNGWVFKHAVINYTQGFNFVWNEIPVTVTFESNWRKAKKIIEEIGEHHTAIRSEHAAEQVRQAARKYLIFFHHLTPIVWTSVVANGVTLTLRYLCDPRRRRVSECQIWEEILTSFAREKDIDFAYPTQRFYNNVQEGKPGTRPTPPPAEQSLSLSQEKPSAAGPQ
jgi:small-conductance mechanosensitive channel